MVLHIGPCDSGKLLLGIHGGRLGEQQRWCRLTWVWLEVPVQRCRRGCRGWQLV